MYRCEEGNLSQAEDLAKACADRELDTLLQDRIVEALIGALQDYSIDSRLIRMCQVCPDSSPNKTLISSEQAWCSLKVCKADIG